jgi:CheY-like chemotaxis protein
MGGRIGVTSSEGEGSTFWFIVPLQKCPGEAPFIEPSPTQSPLQLRKPLRVLVVEDNAVNQKLAMAQLQKLGCQPQAVSNGQEAVAECLRCRPDLILMDCHMPEMDGFEATRRIRALQDPSLPAVRIAAVTACAMQGDREACLEAGMDDYISKPVEPEQLKILLRRNFPEHFNWCSGVS